MKFPLLCILSLVCFAAPRVYGQGDHQHDHGQTVTKAAPKVFLDKSPKVIEYQLKRLTNSELLLVERSVDDAKFAPVYVAILARAGMSSGERREAAGALAKLKSSTVSSELIAALDALNDNEEDSLRLTRDLTGILLSLPSDELAADRSSLDAGLKSKQSATRKAVIAALVLAGETQAMRAVLKSQPEIMLDFLAAVTLLEPASLRDAFRAEIFEGLSSTQPLDVRRQAIQTLGTLIDQTEKSFEILSGLSSEDELRDAAIKSLLKLPSKACPTPIAQQLVRQIVERAVATTVDVRSSETFLDATQLAESLLPLLDGVEAKRIRTQLRDITVRVVRVRTVEEEMRYDLKYFAVEAGKPVEIVLINEDLMPHNLVVTLPGAAKEVALTAAAMAPDEATDGKQYVPRSAKVLFATHMVQTNKQERLAFTAPSEPGEYPYVCTFPNHWMRMIGVMVVVADLDAYMKDPKPPADPIGNNRSFVRKWTTDDLLPQLEAGLRGRSDEIGQRLFTEATCAQCHKLRGTGGSVGPDLTDVAKRWKGDNAGIVREMVDASYKVDPKYASQSILTVDGKVYSGIIVAEDKTSLSVVSNPEQKAPLIIARDNIDEIVKSSKSIMPAGLLDQFTQDEIYELLSYMLKP